VSEGRPPFPESLCHSCSAPPRYVKSDRGSVFIHCPILQRYPPQPVIRCGEYRPVGDFMRPDDAHEVS